MIRALDTPYRGYVFRSRLEARWAVFLTALDIPFEYETQGYDLSGVYYLPDFWLPDHNIFLEVKPYKPTVTEEYKAFKLASEMEKHVYIAFGGIPFPTGKIKFDNDSMWGYFGGKRTKNNLWCYCDVCKTYGISQYGYTVMLPCHCNLDSLKKSWGALDILRAYQKARSERFE